MSRLSRKEEDKIEYMLQTCAVHFTKLSKWEQDFIDSITAQWEAKKWLSAAQEEWLEKIHVKLP